MISDDQIDKALTAFYPGSKAPWPWAARHAMEAALAAAQTNAGNQMLIDEAIWDKGFAAGIEAAANRHQEGAQAAETWQDTNEAIRALRPDATPVEK